LSQGNKNENNDIDFEVILQKHGDHAQREQHSEDRVHVFVELLQRAIDQELTVQDRTAEVHRIQDCCLRDDVGDLISAQISRVLLIWWQNVKSLCGFNQRRWNFEKRVSSVDQRSNQQRMHCDFVCEECFGSAHEFRPETFLFRHTDQRFVFELQLLVVLGQMDLIVRNFQRENAKKNHDELQAEFDCEQGDSSPQELFFGINVCVDQVRQQHKKTEDCGFERIAHHVAAVANAIGDFLLCESSVCFVFEVRRSCAICLSRSALHLRR
jgi:hypothetical protein